MSNILFVSSPLQAINAISVIKQFVLDDYSVIIVNSNEIVYGNILSILKSYKILNYRRIQFEDFGDLIKYYFKKRKKIGTNSVNKVFIGDYEEISHLILAKVHMNKETELYLIDDGNNTILGYSNGFTISKIRRYKSFNSFIKYLLCDIVINPKRMRENINIFSIFPPQTIISFNYIKNNLLYLKSAITSAKYIKGVYIIGSPIELFSRISSELYMKIIKNIIDTYPTEPIYYMPHRKEKKEIMSNLNAREEIKWIDNDTCVELFFINNRIYPKVIYGFGSTALLTIKELYSETEIYDIGFGEEKKKHLSSKVKEYQIIEEYNKRFGLKNISVAELL